MTFKNPQYLVTTAWLEDHLSDPELRILDCTLYLPNYFDESASRRIQMVSGRANWEQGHIPGSAFVDLRDDLCDSSNDRFMYPMPPAEQFAAVMSRLGVGPGTRVVLYDDILNMYAARVWWMLRAFGFENAAVLDGGWKKWKAEGRAVSTEPAAYPPARFEATFRPDRIATRDQVKDAMDSKGTCLLNALDAEEFAGRGPQRYRRAGRIPSSVNVSFVECIDHQTNAFLPPEQLREKFAAVGALDAGRVITYCGGAIAASNASLILTLLGAQDVALYDGSMTEWAADPTLPMDLG